jgi:hypothetical protein
VALYFDAVPDAFQLAVGADEKCAADDAEKRAAEEFLHAARVVGFDCFEVGVAEEIEVQFLFGFEAGLGFHGIAAHAEDDYAELVEVFFCVAKLGRFGRSAGSVGFGVEEKDEAFAGEVGE